MPGFWPIPILQSGDSLNETTANNLNSEGQCWGAKKGTRSHLEPQRGHRSEQPRIKDHACRDCSRRACHLVHPNGIECSLVQNVVCCCLLLFKNTFLEQKNVSRKSSCLFWRKGRFFRGQSLYFVPMRQTLDSVIFWGVAPWFVCCPHLLWPLQNGKVGGKPSGVLPKPFQRRLGGYMPRNLLRCMTGLC